MGFNSLDSIEVRCENGLIKSADLSVPGLPPCIEPLQGFVNCLMAGFSGRIQVVLNEDAKALSKAAEEDELEPESESALLEEVENVRASFEVLFREGIARTAEPRFPHEAGAACSVNLEACVRELMGNREPKEKFSGKVRVTLRKGDAFTRGLTSAEEEVKKIPRIGQTVHSGDVSGTIVSVEGPRVYFDSEADPHPHYRTLQRELRSCTSMPERVVSWTTGYRDVLRFVYVPFS